MNRIIGYAGEQGVPEPDGRLSITASELHRLRENIGELTAQVMHLADSIVGQRMTEATSQSIPREVASGRLGEVELLVKDLRGDLERLASEFDRLRHL